MKYSFAIAALAAAASAQSIASLVAEIPTCADSCFIQGIPKVCPNGITDYACQCKPANKATLTKNLTGCIVSACGIPKAEMVGSITNQICSVYLANPSSSAAAATTTAAMSSVASSAAAASSAVLATSSGAAMVMSSSMMASSSAVAVATSMMASSSAAVGQKTDGQITVTSALASPTAFTGAAGPMVTAAPALMAAAGLAALIL